MFIKVKIDTIGIDRIIKGVCGNIINIEHSNPSTTPSIILNKVLILLSFILYNITIKWGIIVNNKTVKMYLYVIIKMQVKDNGVAKIIEILCFVLL